MMCQALIPSRWDDREAHHIANEHCFEVEDLHSLDDQITWRQCVPRAHISTGKGRPFCVDFYTFGT